MLFIYSRLQEVKEEQSKCPELSKIKNYLEQDIFPEKTKRANNMR